MKPFGESFWEVKWLHINIKKSGDEGCKRVIGKLLLREL